MAVSEREWLKNVETGGIFPSTVTLLKHSFMIPCNSPDIENETPGAEHDMKDTSKPVPVPGVKIKPEPVSDTLSKDEGLILIKKWFSKPVDKVTVAELYEYAEKQTGEKFPEKMTKLQIVTKLAAEMAVREE